MLLPKDCVVTPRNGMHLPCDGSEATAPPLLRERERGCPRRARALCHQASREATVCKVLTLCDGLLLPTEESCSPLHARSEARNPASLQGLVLPSGRALSQWDDPEPGRALAHGVFRTATSHHPGFPVRTPSPVGFSPTISPLAHIS